MTYKYHADRRSFLKTSGLAGAALAAGTSGAFAQAVSSSRPTTGDKAILRFLSAVEQLESDLWQQYNELGGIQDSEEHSGSGNGPYTKALQNLDSDMPQYIHDNTDDEFSHHDFINKYLESVGAKGVDLIKLGFATIPGSKAPGSSGKKRLTNLMELKVDTSYWGRYRSRTENPDLDPSAKFPQPVPDLAKNTFPAIPRDKNDTNDKNQIQTIANTAAFHFGFIEVGGTSLYPTLALRVTDPVVLRILLSIGPSETMHFQVWHDKAGNAVIPPVAPVNFGSLTFPDLSGAGEDLRPNLIMPEPCPFLKGFPAVSIIRPVSTVSTTFGAKAAVTGLTDDGLFNGQSQSFFALMNELAEAADAATRKC